MVQTFRFIWNHPLSSQNRFAAFGRWWRWQVSSRILRMPVMVPWVEKTALIMEKGMTGATGNFYCGLHEFTEMAFLLHFLREHDGFVDIGANVGTYTILASFVVGAKSYAFEPLPLTHAKLFRNLAFNRGQNPKSQVVSYMAAVGQQAGSVYFTADRDTMNQVVSKDFQGPKVEVPMVRLDDVLQNFDAILWKIDVEGYEEEVLKGAQERLEHSGLKAIILETETPWIIKSMQTMGFERSSYSPFTRTLHPRDPCCCSHNQLWIRDQTFCKERVKKARIFTVAGVDF